MANDFRIGETNDFIVEHCFSCALPGYLIVSPRFPVRTIAGLEPDALRRMGPALAAAVRTVEAAVSPVRVYCALFGEEQETMHFHVFPRTREITGEYLKIYPDQKDLIHGPVLLDWARERYRADEREVFRIVSPWIDPLREHFARFSREGERSERAGQV